MRTGEPEGLERGESLPFSSQKHKRLCNLHNRLFYGYNGYHLAMALVKDFLKKLYLG